MKSVIYLNAVGVVIYTAVQYGYENVLVLCHKLD